MRYSFLKFPTLREAPGEAEVVSHALMLRAGMIRKVASGIYSILPLGTRVLAKVQQVIREEMTKAGALEVILPAVQPAELWQQSGRWEKYGKELLRFKDRHDRWFCLGPTHEEVITDLVRRDIRSYRQLPLTLFQIQMKFRDEIRPRFGLMRGREFLMKDAYSFDRDEEGAKASYERMYEAYTRIFTRCGLTFRAVEADTGLIGGTSSHEFMVLAETGEEQIASCDACHYAANVERADCRPTPSPPEGEGRGEGRTALLSLKEVTTPGKHRVEEVAAFLNVPPDRLVKTLIYQAPGKGKDEAQVVAVLIRGDHELNEVKLSRLLNAVEVLPADVATVQRVSGGPVGFTGPVGLTGITILADHAATATVNAVVGGNRADLHLVNANHGRDFTAAQVADLRQARAGDPCPRCTGTYRMTRGLEVGHVFMLGEQYSKAMEANYLDVTGQWRPFVMGCYGIGVGRTMAAAVEQNHDDRGIIWPIPIAPFTVVILPLQDKAEPVRQAAERLYAQLQEAGVEVLLDDRPERPGVKFNDADLLGIPYHLIIGERTLAEGQVELKTRRTGETRKLPLDTVMGQVREALNADR